MALRTIIVNGDPILRKKSRQVDQVDDRIRAILNDMAETMYHHGNGAGLAACQVGILKRLVVIDMGDGLLKLVNPKVVETSGSHEVIEGCLSFPNVWGIVVRPEKVTIEALNENGEKITLSAEGDLAKCFCHEIDHLDGIVFTDKVIKYLDL